MLNSRRAVAGAVSPRSLFGMRHALGLSYREISEALQVGKTSVGEFVRGAEVVGFIRPLPQPLAYGIFAKNHFAKAAGTFARSESPICFSDSPLPIWEEDPCKSGWQSINYPRSRLRCAHVIYPRLCTLLSPVMRVARRHLFAIRTLLSRLIRVTLLSPNYTCDVARVSALLEVGQFYWAVTRFKAR